MDRVDTTSRDYYYMKIYIRYKLLPNCRVKTAVWLEDGTRLFSPADETVGLMRSRVRLMRKHGFKVYVSRWADENDIFCPLHDEWRARG